MLNIRDSLILPRGDSIIMSYWKLMIISAIVVVVKSELPLDFVESVARNDEPDSYRLPEDLDPISFDVEITPYFEAQDGKDAFTFDGIVTITLKALREGLTSLIIQENVPEIVSVTLTDEVGIPVYLNETNPFERIRQYHFLRINLRNGLTLVNQQNYVLKIEYIGNINETPLSRGIFRGSYRGSDGRIHWYAASHLQPVNSRQAFPCFDEPGFKSYFNIIINRPANFTQSYSNMKIAQEIPNGNRVKEIFHTTPRMSAYLVTIHISEEFTVIADNNNDARSYRIIARPNAQGQGSYALEVGPPITSWLEDYLSIPYYTMGEDMKNDQIAVPDWASGATENWGLVSYRELRLLYEEGETNAVDRMNIGTITAHELAHKWFGNLITCRWWDNVWINEGFASYFEYFAMDGVDPTLELDDQFNIMYLQSALSADASASTRALQHTVNSPAEVTGHFSGISYTKGASLLQMLRHFVSDSTFRKGLNYFLVDRAYEHAFPQDFYTNFARAVQEEGTVDSSLDMAEFIRYWVEEPGYPILNVEVDASTGVISLSQERFFINAETPSTLQFWPLPLTYTTESNPDWNDLTPKHVMVSPTDTIQKDARQEWVIFNVQQKGIYRVNYDTNNWELIADTLRENFNNIHFLNRAQIVDDVFALMRSERMTYELGFRILDFLKNDTSYYVWYPAITGFSWLRNRLLHLSNLLAEFDEILFEFLNEVITDLGYDVQANEPLTRTLNRFYILSFACNIGHEGCINDAVQKFSAVWSNGVSLNPNLRRHVFCKGIHEGGYDHWLFMYQRRLNSNNQADQVAMLRALGCTVNQQAIREYLDMILSDNVKAQDRLNAFTFLYVGDRSNTKPVLEFLKTRMDDVRRSVVLEASSNSVISGLASYMDEEGLQEMEEWLRSNQDLPEYATGISAVASARASMQWGTENADRILEAAKASAFAIVPSTLLLFTTLIAFLWY